MAEISVSVQASGFEEIEKEAKRLFTVSVAKELSNAVYADMKAALEDHIREDVYREYTPKKNGYERRSDDPNRGVSLLASVEDEDYTKQLDPLDYATGNVIAGLSYEPTGEHENWRWSDTGGDELIGRIEKKEPKYNWEPRDGSLKERPFWQNFVTEMIEGGRFARVVEEELKRMGIAEKTDHISGVTRENADGNY